MPRATALHLVYDEIEGKLMDVCAACARAIPEPPCQFCCLGGEPPEHEDVEPTEAMEASHG